MKNIQPISWPSLATSSKTSFRPLRPKSELLRLVIQIEQNLAPVTAAAYLWQGLNWTLGYYRGAIPAQELDLSLAARNAVGAAAAEIGVMGARAYLSALSIINEGADFVLTIQEVSEGNLSAAFGFLPILPGSVFSQGGKVFLRLPGGQVLGEFTESALDALRRASTKTTLAARMDELEPLNLPLKTREAMVDGGFLAAPKVRGELRRNMLQEIGPAPAHFTNGQAHHNLPWTLKEWFAAHGLDVNKAEYGRWVEGTPPGPHQRWTPQFEAAWVAFKNNEIPESPYTRQQILDEMNILIPLFPAE